MNGRAVALIRLLYSTYWAVELPNLPDRMIH